MKGPTFCIVGAGLAGGRAASALRERGFGGRLVLLGDEAEPPYERPPLSKAYLAGELARDKLWLRPAAAYRELAIEWRPQTTVSAVDLKARRLRLTEGSAITFDRLLLATGSRPRALEIPGSQLAGVSTYRTLADADALDRELGRDPRVLVVGGGFLGTELAAVARRRGCRVSLVELGEALLAPLGALAGAHCERLHRQAGVELHLGVTVRSFLGGARLEAAELSDGRSLPCDLALVCVGATPNSELAGEAGLAIDPGVVVDERGRSSDPAVHAAGDVASWWSPLEGRRIRVEHYDNAHQQGVFAAGAMLGDSAAYEPVPYFWTEQYESLVQEVGFCAGEGRAVLRGDPESRSFAVFHLGQGRLLGCVAVNRFPDLAAARRLIASRAPVTAELLGDAGLDLRAWSRAAAEAAGAPAD